MATSCRVDHVCQNLQFISSMSHPVDQSYIMLVCCPWLLAEELDRLEQAFDVVKKQLFGRLHDIARKQLFPSSPAATGGSQNNSGNGSTAAPGAKSNGKSASNNNVGAHESAAPAKLAAAAAVNSSSSEHGKGVATAKGGVTAVANVPPATKQ